MKFASQKPKWMDVNIYSFTLYTNRGFCKKIRLIGVKSISNFPKPMDVEEAYALFPHVKHGVLTRPHLPVGMLIGSDWAEFLPYRGSPDLGERVDGLLCLNSPMGSGHVLTGRHHLIKSTPVSIDTDVNVIRSALSIQPEDMEVKSINFIQRQWLDIENVVFEKMSVRVPPLCNKCGSCQYCSKQRSELSKEEQEVLKLVESGMTIDPEKGEIRARYPMNENVEMLEDNISGESQDIVLSGDCQDHSHRR